MSPCSPSGLTARAPRLTATTRSTTARTGKDAKAAARPGPGPEMPRRPDDREGAKPPARLRPDCATPPVRLQGPMRPQGNQDKGKCLVNVHANQPLAPSPGEWTGSSQPDGRERHAGPASRAGRCPARTRRADDSNGDSNRSGQRRPAATATAHNARTIRSSLGQARPEKQTPDVGRAAT